MKNDKMINFDKEIIKLWENIFYNFYRNFNCYKFYSYLFY